MKGEFFATLGRCVLLNALQTLNGEVEGQSTAMPAVVVSLWHSPV